MSMPDQGGQRQAQSPDVAIAIPHTGTVSMRWAIRLSELQMPPHTIVSKSTAAIDLAREMTVEDALETDPEWILFMDSDVIPPADVFHRLRSHGVDIVSGLYYMDNPDGIHPAMWRLDEHDAPTITDYQREGLINVDCVGFGCLLVNRDVIDDIEPPYFRWTKGYDEHPWDLQHQGEKPGVSEDFFFCHKAIQEGYEIYVDTRTKCIHGKQCYLTDDGLFLQSQLNPDHIQKVRERQRQQQQAQQRQQGGAPPQQRQSQQQGQGQPRQNQQGHPQQRQGQQGQPQHGQPPQGDPRGDDPRR